MPAPYTTFKNVRVTGDLDVTGTFDQQEAGLGWADYVDTQYTSESAFAVSANTDTNLPNNAGTARATYLPSDLTAFYADGKITGREGEALLITVDMKVIPGVGCTLIEDWIDIGGSVGELYRRPSTFPKGQGIVRSIVHTTAVYTLDTWAQNGGTVKVRANGPCEIYDIRYVIFRVFKP